MTALDKNPLLRTEFAVAFDSIEAAHVEPAITELIKRAGAALVAIEDESENRSYDNTPHRLEQATEWLEVASTVVGHLESVASTPELRTAYNEVRPTISEFFAGIPLRTKLYEALKTYADSEDAKQLSGARKRFLEKTLIDFRRHGAELDDTGKARLTTLSRKLAELTSRFSQNVVDATAEFELLITDEAELSGLPDSAIAAAAQGAKQKKQKGWRFTLQAPSLIPLITYMASSEIREKVYRASNARASRGKLANPPLIAKIIELRKEQARLLGYADFADFVLEDRMAKTGHAARDFVEELTGKSHAAFQKESAELADFRRELEGAAAPAIKSWDVPYYAEKRRRALFDFDEEQLRPYFVVDRVIEGLFRTARELYGVDITENTELPRWHSDVRCYDIKEADGTFLASFYADLFPRDEKRGGAWMNAFITGAWGAQPSPHLALICANVTPPVGDAAATLTHNEVTTLFHEFGHLLHHCLSRVTVRSLAGTNVAWDFVELPSQIMENWCWQREALDTFARHQETGEAIPEELFVKMTAARTYREASAMMRQLGFASVDMKLHVEYDSTRDGDLLAYCRQAMEQYAPVRFEADYAMIAGFSHLFSSAVGYAAGYYSYKWAEVLDADAFTRFQKEGIFSREVGQQFREAILERGDGAEPMDLYIAFMGRKPSLDALLERSGLAS